MSFEQVENKVLTYWLPSGVDIGVIFDIGQEEFQGNPGTFRSIQVW